MPKTSKPTLASVINKFADHKVRNAAVALPGIIVKFNGVTADIQPGVHRLTPNEEDPDLDDLEQLPVIPNVPIMWVQAVGIKVRATLRVGDPVLILAMDRDIAVWRKSGKVSAPNDARYHHWGSCVAIPGLIPNTDPFPEPGDAAALASLCLARLEHLTEKYNDLLAAFKNHTHTTAGTGAPTPPTTFAPPGPLPLTLTDADDPDSVASTILKLEE